VADSTGDGPSGRPPDRPTASCPPAAAREQQHEPRGRRTAVEQPQPGSVGSGAAHGGAAAREQLARLDGPQFTTARNFSRQSLIDPGISGSTGPERRLRGARDLH